MSDMETCGNCGHRIGQLEEAHFWKDHVVCTACKEALTREAKAKSRSKVGAAVGASSSSAHSASVSSSTTSSSASNTGIRLKPAAGEIDITFKSDDEAPAARVDEPFPSPADADVPSPALSSSPRSRSSSSTRSGVHSRQSAPKAQPCAQCGALCSAANLTNVDGQLFCESCATFAAAGVEGAEPAEVFGAAAPKGKSSLPPWMPLAIAGAVVLAVILVSAFFLIHGGGGADEDAAAPPTASVRKPAAPVAAAAALPVPAATSDSVAPAPAAPTAPAVDDAAEAQKLLDAMLAASELEAAGQRVEALKHYQQIVDGLAAKPERSESQTKSLARAQAAVQRLSAAASVAPAPVAAPARPAPPASVFDETPAAPAAAPASSELSTSIPEPAPVAAAAGPADDGFDDAPTAGLSQAEAEEVVAGRPSAADKPAVAGIPAGIKPPAASVANPAAAAAKPAAGINIHLENGKQALANSDYPAAMQAFKDALDFDKKSPHAMHGVGLSHFYLNEPKKCVEVLEKAVVNGSNRALVYNLGVVHMKDNPMRAAKYVKDYLAKPTTPLDEPLQNMLGAALDAAGATNAKSGTVFMELRKFYFEYDSRLAAARKDGTRRWGVHWIPAAQADSKWNKSKTAIAEADKTDLEFQRSKIKTKKAEEKLNDLNRSFGLIPERKYIEARQGIKNALLYEAEARKRRDAAAKVLSGTEMPEFPKYLQFIPIDALTVDQHPQM